MKRKHLSRFILLLFSFSYFTLFAQQRSCGTEQHIEQLMQNAEYRILHEEKLMRMAEMAIHEPEDRTVLCPNPVILPVAIHFQEANVADRACLEALAQNQIDILNQDFQGLNSDISNWTNNASTFFPGVNHGETCVEFCIATQNHPSGYGLNNGDLAVTISQNSGDFNGDWSGYINIYVRNIQYLGYSPVGGNGNGDGVVIDNNAFGSSAGCTGASPNAPYDKGRTLTHEMGHYLLLNHIWGGGNGGCVLDDGVSDTPISASEYYGCPALGASSCGNTDMHMNYMDYTNDACMYVFSAGQSTRMENYVSASLSNLANNAVIVCDSTYTPPVLYCGAGGQDVSSEWIANVNIGNFSNTSGAATYSDFTNQVIVLDTGLIIPVTLTPGYSGEPFSEYWRIWIDYNGDFDFTDEGELVVEGVSTTTIIDSFIVPATSVDTTRMRIAMKWATAPNSCEIFSFGEVEDYKLVLSGNSTVPNPCACPINNYVVPQNDPTRMRIHWDSVEVAITYSVRYRIQGASTWTIRRTPKIQKRLHNLSTTTIYEYQLRSRCINEWSDWSPVFTFTSEDGN